MRQNRNGLLRSFSSRLSLFHSLSLSIPLSFSVTLSVSSWAALPLRLNFGSQCLSARRLRAFCILDGLLLLGMFMLCVCGAIARDAISVVSVILYGHKWPAVDCCCLLPAVGVAVDASVTVAVGVAVVVAVTPKNPVPVYPQQAACADVVVVVVVVIVIVVVVVVVLAVFVAGPIASRLPLLWMLPHKPHSSVK